MDVGVETDGDESGWEDREITKQRQREAEREESDEMAFDCPHGRFLLRELSSES